METIFDFDLTPKEKKKWTIGCSTAEEYIKILEATKDSTDSIEDVLNWQIANLLMYRGQKEQAEVYINKLTDPEHFWDNWNSCHLWDFTE